MAFPSAHRSSCSHIPQEDEFVSADRGEGRVVGCDSEIEDFVAVGASVFLDEVAFCGVEEADGAIGGAGEEVLCAG